MLCQYVVNPIPSSYIAPGGTFSFFNFSVRTGYLSVSTHYNKDHLDFETYVNATRYFTNTNLSNTGTINYGITCSWGEGTESSPGYAEVPYVLFNPFKLTGIKSITIKFGDTYARRSSTYRTVPEVHIFGMNSAADATKISLVSSSYEYAVRQSAIWSPSNTRATSSNTPWTHTITIKSDAASKYTNFVLLIILLLDSYHGTYYSRTTTYINIQSIVAQY